MSDRRERRLSRRWLHALAAVWAASLARAAAAGAARAPPLQVVVAENQGVLFCLGCADPMREGSYVPALTNFYNPSNYFVFGEVVYGVPNRGEDTLLNADEVRGRIAMFERGKVAVARKVHHAQQAGAIGVIVVDTASCDAAREPCFDDQFEKAARLASVEPSVAMFEGDPPSAWRGVRIPSVLISAVDGARLRRFMALDVFELDGETHYIN